MGDPMVPALRFINFHGDYEPLFFGDFVKNISKKFKRNDFDSVIPCIELEDLSQGTALLLNKRYLTTESGDRNTFQKGDVLFGKLRPYLKKYFLASFLGVCSLEIWVLRTKNVLNTYLFYLIQTEYFYSIVSVSSGTKMPRASWKYVSSKKFYLPNNSEQQKIADFLSSVDKKIEQLTRKKELLEKYKTGMMQKLFPKAGEQHPELRFKDENGQDFPDWDIKSLDNICVISKGEQLNKNELFESGLYPSISGGINPSGYTDKWNTDAGTIIISEGGNSCGYVNFIDTKFWCGGHCYKIQNIEDLHIYFLYQCLKFYERNIMRLRVGSGLPNIQKKDISRFLIIYPSLPEQQKIADFLSAIDKKITKVEGKLTKAQTFKKGLLQQMFV